MTKILPLICEYIRQIILSSYLLLVVEVMVCLLAALHVQLSISMGSGSPHNVSWYHWVMPSRLYSTAGQWSHI